MDDGLLEVSLEAWLSTVFSAAATAAAADSGHDGKEFVARGSRRICRGIAGCVVFGSSPSATSDLEVVVVTLDPAAVSAADSAAVGLMNTTTTQLH